MNATLELPAVTLPLNSSDIIEVFAPFSGEPLGAIALHSPEYVKTQVEIAAGYAHVVRKIPKYKRAEILHNVAKHIYKNEDGLTRLLVTETGKTWRESNKEVKRCANTFTISSEEAKRLEGETISFNSFSGSDDRQGYFTREPLGVVACITPYNDPLNLAAHKLGPAIAAGNCIVFKPSELAPYSAMRLMELIFESGFPKNALRLVTGDASTGKALVEHKDVRAVSFTGGLKTADAIVRSAGAKKYLMDLGGNAPVIVMDDCNLNNAVESCFSGAFWAAGQNCIGTQRLLVQKSIYKDFIHSFVSKVQSIRHGDPMEKETDIGPMISEAVARKAQDLVNQAIRRGAKLQIGNFRKGCFYSPTIITNVSRDDAIWKEEVFAPIAIVESFDSLEEALALANDCEVALHGGIFTNNLQSALRTANEMQVSGVMINDSSDYRHDGMPFGGFKKGSMGREGVKHAILELTQPKVICFKNSRN